MITPRKLIARVRCAFWSPPSSAVVPVAFRKELLAAINERGYRKDYATDGPTRRLRALLIAGDPVPFKLMDTMRHGIGGSALRYGAKAVARAARIERMEADWWKAAQVCPAGSGGRAAKRGRRSWSPGDDIPGWAPTAPAGGWGTAKPLLKFTPHPSKALVQEQIEANVGQSGHGTWALIELDGGVWALGPWNKKWNDAAIARLGAPASARFHYIPVYGLRQREWFVPPSAAKRK